MTSVADVFARVRRDYLNQGQREQRNRLATSIVAADTTLTFANDLNQLGANSIISIGLEDIYVWSTVEATKTAEVDRGVDGSTAAIHATTEHVRVNPRYSDATLLRALNSELGNLHAQGLFKVGHRDITYSSATVGYALAAPAIDSVYMVQVENYTGDDWQTIGGWNFEPGQDTTDFPSGNALYVWGGALPSRPLRAITFEPFTSLTALDDDVTTDGGLPSTAIDVLAMGVALTLGAGREVSRNDTRTQGDTRRADEVPPGAQAGSTNPIARQYANRLRNEVALLTQKYPPRRK